MAPESRVPERTSDDRGGERVERVEWEGAGWAYPYAKGRAGSVIGNVIFMSIADGGRLAHLNVLYGTIYPGLRYVTFVNGRSRAAIIPEMEGVLGLPLSPQPLPEGFQTSHPAIGSGEISRMIQKAESEGWRSECTRGLEDVWRIGRARLAGLGLQ